MKKPKQLKVRAYMLHLSHYDPWWNERKGTERPYSQKVALAAVDAMAESGFNTVVLDCEDAVKYKSHPELKRRYTVPMSRLVALAKHARKRGLDVIPKINFAQSHLHRHNHWFRPHHWLFDSPEYWRRSFRIVDELIRACRPKRFFHVGMDEDHERSWTQYARAIATLYRGLKKRGLRAVIWNDSAYPMGRAWVHAEKCQAAEDHIPKGVVEVVWDYSRIQPQILKRLRRKGFTVWFAPGRGEDRLRRCREKSP